jgi:chemotaxis protein CheC
MGGSYVNAIANLSGMTIDMSVPALTTDMLGAIMTVPATELSEAYERVLMISEQFLIDSVEIQSDMLLIPTVESLRTLLGKLGVEDQ